MQQDEAEAGTSISVTMEFGIIFVKSTMFKGMISKKTSAEMVLYFESMAQFMSDAVSGVLQPTAPSLMVEPTSTTMLAEAPITSSAAQVEPSCKYPPTATTCYLHSMVSIDRVIIFCIVILQIWILIELRGIKRTLLESGISNTNAAKNGGGKCPVD